jgi:hypothetical protein
MVSSATWQHSWLVVVVFPFKMAKVDERGWMIFKVAKVDERDG